VAPIDVTLTDDEVARSVKVAEKRNAASCTFTQRHGYVGDPLAPDLPGAAGEAAFCKATGIVWSESVNTFKHADVRHNLQIRTAPCRAPKPPDGFGTLIVRDTDHPLDYFVLVAGRSPHFRVLGWISGADAKQDHWLRSESNRPPAWFVPNAALNKDLSEILLEA